MSCTAHASKTKNCRECFGNELIALALRVQRDIGAMPNSVQLQLLKKEYASLALAAQKDSKEFVALCASLLSTINVAILSNNGEPISWEDAPAQVVAPVSAQERLAYLGRLKRMGTWVGYTEFTVIARCFDLCFGIMVRVDDHWERMDIGTGNPTLGAAVGGNGRALRFDRSHYEVATFNHTGHGRYAEQIGTVVETNGHGDCGLESFLLLLALENPAHNVALPDQGRIRQLRAAFQPLAAAPGRPVNAASADYQTAISMLRALIAYRMYENEATHAVLAEGRLDAVSESTSKAVSNLVVAGPKSKGWGEYVGHVGKYFALSRSLTSEVTEDDSLAVVTNIAQIPVESLLKKSNKTVTAVLSLTKKVESRYYREAEILDGEHKRTVNLTHIGFMVAKIDLKNKKTCHFVSTIANFSAGRKDEVSPYMVTGSSLETKSVSLPKTEKTGSQAELFSALDMHTECYSFFMLDRFIQQRLGAENVASIELSFVLQLDMCHRCQAAHALFDVNYGVKQATVASAERNQSMDCEIVSDALEKLRRASAKRKWDPFA
ncbi:MAG: hypothetical protein QM784_11745 [Polyangiaceae bacterium]